MKTCRYCFSTMHSEYETNARDFHRYKVFHFCPKCGAICDEDVTEKNGTRVVHEEHWYAPDTKGFEDR